MELTDKEWKTLYNWIDFNAPYYGQFINISKVNEFDQYDRRIELAHKYNQAGVDWRKELADYAEVLKSKGAIQPVMPAPVRKPKPNVKVSGWPFDKNEAQKNSGRRKENPSNRSSSGSNDEFCVDTCRTVCDGM